MEVNLFKVGNRERVGMSMLSDYGYDGGGAGGGGSAVYSGSGNDPLMVQDSYYIGPATIYSDPNQVDNTIPTTAFVPETAPSVAQTNQVNEVTTASFTNQVESRGGFYDSKGNSITAQWKWYNVKTGEVYGEAVSIGFHVWGDTDLENVALRVRASGYQDVQIMALQLQPENNITLRRIPYALYLAAIGALILFAKKRKKKVGKVTVQDVVPFLFIGGGILAFSLVKQILENLGIWDSRDTKDLDNASTDPGSFWNPTFWQTVKPAGESWSYAITYDTAVQWAHDLYNSFGAFNDDEEKAIGVFKRCRTQANASFLCDVFGRVYGVDCLTFLRGGWWPQDRLSDADVNIINNYINRLPKY